MGFALGRFSMRRRRSLSVSVRGGAMPGRHSDRKGQWVAVAVGSAALLAVAPMVPLAAGIPTGSSETLGVAAPPLAPAASAHVLLKAAPIVRRSASASIPGAPATPVEAPANLNDPAGWIDYQARNHIASLPQEARLFYRRGLLLQQSGGRDEAVRMVRDASTLDPTFVAPHLTLASWFLLRDPSQALLQYAAVLELARQNFVLQLALAANALYIGLQALFLGLLAAAFLTVWIYHRELRHGWLERLSQFLSPETARWWSWGFLILPYAAGLGPALPTAVFLAMLWPSLRKPGRALFVTFAVMLGAAPWITATLDRFAAPLRENEAPYFGVPMIEAEPYSGERQTQLAQLAATHADSPFLAFALGWTARRGGDLAAAESAYRRALSLWPRNDRVMNDLGNTLAMEGHPDEALQLYLGATAANPSNAAAYFNLSQIYTQRFDYRAATDALARASALNFDMVKNYQSGATDDGALPLVDQWIAPHTLWSTMSLDLELQPRAAALPPSWRGRLECSGLPYSALAMLLVGGALAFGLWQHRLIPLRACSNCGDVVCRRCAQRRRELALCPTCVAVEGRAESPDFARVLLLQHRRSLLGKRHLARTALATSIPGYGLLSFGRVFVPLFLLTLTAALASSWLGLKAPFSYEPRLTLSEGEVPIPLMIGMWVMVYAWSMVGYFGQVAQANASAADLAAPVRSRSTQATRRVNAAAA